MKIDFRDRIIEEGVISENTEEGYRIWKAIKCGDHMVSIQASKYHYSAPRKTLPSPFDYFEFEVAAWPVDLSVSWSHWTWMDISANVAGYQTVEQVQAIVDYFCNLTDKDDNND
jgi:hypothetical protein